MTEQSQSTLVRCNARFQGQVQGVGFRFTTCRCARPYAPAVNGWVKNEQDGSVTLVAEGPRERVESFLAELQSRMERNIRNAAIHWSEPSGEFSAFEIRY